MMELAVAAAWLALGMVSINALAWPRVRRRGRTSEAPVSILIPARDEENTIGACLEAAAAQGGCGTSVQKFEHLPTWHTEPNGEPPPCPGMPCMRQRALFQAPSRAPSGTGRRGGSRTALRRPAMSAMQTWQWAPACVRSFPGAPRCCGALVASPADSCKQQDCDGLP